MHAEAKTTAAVILMAELYKKPIHVCHVARKEEVRLCVCVCVREREREKERRERERALKFNIVYVNMYIFISDCYNSCCQREGSSNHV